MCFRKYQLSICVCWQKSWLKAILQNPAWLWGGGFGRVLDRRSKEAFGDNHERNTPFQYLQETRVMPSIDSHQACHIRWMIRGDMPSVLEIENRSFEFPWTEDEFIRCLRQRDCIGMVCREVWEVVGFMIYELHTKASTSFPLPSTRSFAENGVGSAMVEN